MVYYEVLTINHVPRSTVSYSDNDDNDNNGDDRQITTWAFGRSCKMSQIKQNMALDLQSLKLVNDPTEEMFIKVIFESLLKRILIPLF